MRVLAMINRRFTMLVVAVAMAVGLAGVGASAAGAAPIAQRGVVGKSDVGKITSMVIGVTSDRERVRGSFTPVKVIRKKGKLHVRGFLKGVVRHADGSRTRFSGVKAVPIKRINGRKVTKMTRASAARQAECDILNLVLGPLDLNVLGLEIRLQRVVLDIVAVSGAGQLLGNLLCAVAGLLDGSPLAGLLGQLQTLLNRILGLLNLGV